MTVTQEISDNRIDREIYHWQFWDSSNIKEISCTINGIALEIIVTRLEKLSILSNRVLSPNRIHISSDDTEIQKVFTEKLLHQPPFDGWDSTLWVFQSNPNIFLYTQYELHFYPNIASMKESIKQSERGLCSIL